MVEIALLILAVAFFARRGRGKAAAPGGLPDLLSGAESAGIITAAQREQLLTYAGTHASASARMGGAAWLGVFAGLFVVAGVALLIARNWEALGPAVRVGAYLVVLAATGIAAIRARASALALSVPLELLWFFLPLLGIGLYGQTFQLSGDSIAPFLVWLALTVPVAWLSLRPAVATIHTFAMVAVLFAGNFVVEPASALWGGGMVAPPSMLAITEHGTAPAVWLLSIALLASIVVQSLRLLPRAHRHHCVGVVMTWLFAILVAPTPFRIHHEGWIVVAALALVTLWIVVLLALDTSVEERATSLCVWLGLIYSLTFTWHMDRAPTGAMTTGGRTLVLAAAPLVAQGRGGRTAETGTSGRVTTVTRQPSSVSAVEQVSGTTALLIAVSPVNDRIVWLSGARGTWVRTTDGGTTWQTGQVPGADSLQFRDVHAVDANTAYLLSIGEGSASRIYKTTDAGTTWTQQFTNSEPKGFYDCMDFWDAKRGIVMGDAIDGQIAMLRTDDGGATWTRIPRSALPAAQTDEGSFAASGTCVVARKGGHAWIVASNPDHGRVLHTADFGRTWSVDTLPLTTRAGSGPQSVAFRDTRFGMAFGGGNNAVAGDILIAVTANGGSTWAARTSPTRARSTRPPSSTPARKKSSPPASAREISRPAIAWSARICGSW